MAAVLDAFASKLMCILQGMAKEEVETLLGAPGEITKLETTLGGLANHILAEAERRRIRDSSVDVWARHLKGAMYDADDILDLCKLLERGQDPRLAERPAPRRRNIPLLLSCFSKEQVVPHQIGRAIKELNQRLEDLTKNSTRFGFINEAINSSGYSNSCHGNSQRETGAEFMEWDVVGEKIKEDTRKLVQLLLKEAEAHTRSDIDNVVVAAAITGAGGTGKTTLAQMVYNDRMVAENFQMRIWLSVTQEVNETALLENVIALAGGDYNGITGDKAMLEKDLRRAVRHKRFLLVMDDVWSERVWNELLRVPLNGGAPGSRVLVTTRNDVVARGMKAQHHHRVTTLNLEDAWMLLKMQVVVSEEDDTDIDSLKDIGMMISEKCDGLPLAIKVVGGLLRRKSRTRASWLDVLNHLSWSASQFVVLYDSLYLSYQDLDPQLKQCFLYYSLIPKGVNFDSHNVINMWISEGFINQLEVGGSDRLEDTGTKYHQELIMRNLIEPGASSGIHDIVRSFAQYIAREESLVVQREQRNETNRHLVGLNLRRLSIDTTESILVEWDVFQKHVSLRVLIINCKINFKPGDSLSNFSSLRVLHIVRLAGCDKLLTSLCELKHLRYLHLHDSDISRIPDGIGGMKYLQHIGIVNCERFVQLPVSVIKLTQLRSLDLAGSSVDVVPRGFSRLTNLRSLFGFPAHTDDEGQGQDWCSLEELAPLCQLRSLSLEGIEKVNASYLDTHAMISSKEHLSSLHLNGSKSSKSRSTNVSNTEKKQQLIHEVYELLFPPPCLERLVMQRYIGRRLPNWMWAPEAATLRGLRYMALHNLTSCSQLPDGLCQIPCLERLEINKAPLIKHVGPEFLHHGGLQVAFPRLQELVLYGMVEWSGWEWNLVDGVKAMPALEVLHVESCKLRSLPPGLSCHARALTQLVITSARLLESLETFPSLVELCICFSPELRKIARLPRLQKLTIKICSKLSVLEGVPELISLVVEDYNMKTLPGYLQYVSPRYLTLDCNIKLLKSISMGKDGPEWHKISHIQHVKAYAQDGGSVRKWHVLLKTQPYSLQTYIPDSEENLTGGKLVDGDIIMSESTENLNDNDLVGSNIPSASTGVDLFDNDSNELVGIESPREEIIKMLMYSQGTDKKQLQVVSIYGIGGLGKTSMAKAVCRQIANKFECRAFVSVSQRPTDDNEGIIKTILDQVRCPYSSLGECVGQELIDQLIGILKEFLQDKSYLIVIDDIRDVSVWERIKPALIGNNRGSGIIATTYKADVAESIGGVYRLPLLSDEDSKILFYRRLSFDTEEGCPPGYRELSKIILNKCSRLPLAIIYITSLLLNSLNSKAEWKKVCNSVGSGIELSYSVEDMRRRLSRTYNDLPQHLKECFLYLHIFPEDYVIRRDILVHRWLSEGLIHGDDGNNLHELGESYFYQLLDTGMIHPTEFDNDGKALACRVPIVMIDLIVYLLMEEKKRSLEKQNEEETEEKSALQKESEALKNEIEEKHTTTRASQGRTNPLHKVERLSLQLLVSKEQHGVAKATKPLGAAEKKQLYGKEATKSFQQGSLSISCSTDSMDALPIFRHLRVLILEGSLENRHFTNKYLRSLRKLRYLILASTQITAIPKKVGNLRSLLTLDLRATSVNELPCKFVELKQLRCLLVNRSTKVPAGICNLKDLIQLEDINISKSPNILEEICNLPELRFLKITLWSWDDSSSKLLPETLCKMSSNKLKHISICTSCSLEFKPIDIQKKAFQRIEKLVIQHSTFNTIPTWFDKLEKLSSLSIEVYLLEESALRTLGGLPALLFLSLTEKKTPEGRPTAKRTPEGRVVTEDRLVIRSNGFGNLKTFHLFSRAMGIKFEKGSMGKLERLKLSFQASLTVDDFSFSLDNLSSLKHVQVEIICFSTTEKVVKKAEDAIRAMIWGSPKQPRPALDIRRSAEEHMVEDKREFDKDLFLASWDGRMASVQKGKQKQKNV